MDRSFGALASFFRLDDAGWERHANPWSVWTRVAIWPMLALALWSIHWIGWWAAVPLALIAIWTTVNPRAFPPPRSTRSWASRGVFGERIYLARDVNIPAHHRIAARWLAGISGAGSIVMMAGLIMTSLPLFIAGAVTAFFAKMWFVARMASLFDDMARDHPRYAAWLR
jgi:hypothetical protein